MQKQKKLYISSVIKFSEIASPATLSKLLDTFVDIFEKIHVTQR